MSSVKAAFISDGFSGLLCLAVCMPIETLKQRAQINQGGNISMTNEIKKIWKARGIRGFYTGLPA